MHPSPSLFARLPALFAGVLVALGLALTPSDARADKVRDLCDVVGARENQLVGYGIVTGLNGTGDDVSAPFAKQSLNALLRRMGVQVDAQQVRLRNVAAVIVTATIPAFVRSGARIDVTVSSIGNARSLTGGILVQSALRGADRRTYAVAQGPLVIGGFSAAGASGSSVQSNSTTAGRIPNGALVEREIQMSPNQNGKLILALRFPDFATASRLAEVLTKDLGQRPRARRRRRGSKAAERLPRPLGRAHRPRRRPRRDAERERARRHQRAHGHHRGRGRGAAVPGGHRPGRHHHHRAGDQGRFATRNPGGRQDRGR
jgi:flagellar basal body P-ring protein FlgI